MDYNSDYQYFGETKTGALKSIEKETSISRKKLVENAFFQEKPDIIFRVLPAFKSEKTLDLRIKFE